MSDELVIKPPAKMLRMTVKTYDDEDKLKSESSKEVDVPFILDEGKFDMWNEAMDAFGWPDGSEKFMVVTLQDGDHIETKANNSDEGWTTYGEDPGFGLWDYSGDSPKQIKKLGEKL